MKFVSTEVLDAFLNIFLLKDRYLKSVKINNICGKNNNKGVEYRHDPLVQELYSYNVEVN
jgi:hypothetical protein